MHGFLATKIGEGVTICHAFALAFRLKRLLNKFWLQLKELEQSSFQAQH